MATVRRTLDLANPPRLDDAAIHRLGTMSEDEMEAGARSDPDNPPMTTDELDRMAGSRAIRLARLATGLSQAAFAERYGLSLGRMRDLEQGRSYDRAMTAYCLVIRHDPDAVARLVEPVVRTAA